MLKDDHHGLEMAPISARTSGIAKSREELLGLLHDLPESEYELSLTDLVQNGSEAEAEADSTAPAKDAASAQEGDSCSVKAIKERRSRSSRSSRAGSSEGVLLNVYTPALLTRSLAAPSSARRTAPRAKVDCVKREREPAKFGCWSAIWHRGRGKWKKQSLERAR